MATQNEIVEQLNATGATLDKIASETTSLLVKIDELLKIIANIPDASLELVAAADSVKIKAETVDALVTDIPPASP